MIDLEEGIRDLFLEAQAPVMDGIRCFYSRREAFAKEYGVEYYQANREKLIAYSRAYNAVHRADPAFRAKHAADNKLYRERRKNDPAFRASRAEANRRYRLKRKLAPRAD